MSEANLSGFFSRGYVPTCFATLRGLSPLLVVEMSFPMGGFIFCIRFVSKWPLDFSLASTFRVDFDWFYRERSSCSIEFQVRNSGRYFERRRSLFVS